MKAKLNKTYSAKPSEVTRKWYILDASKNSLGRISTVAATLLTGKGKPMFTKHIDCGDYVIVINAKDLVLTSDKLDKKVYYHHTGFPGGIKSQTARDKAENDPTKLVEASVRGMLPVNKLRPARLARLKVYADDKHNHAPQQPEEYTVKENA